MRPINCNESQWFADDVVFRKTATGWFNREYLEHRVQAHQSGASDYSAPLWALLMFEAFLRNVVDETPVSDAALSREAVVA